MQSVAGNCCAMSSSTFADSPTEVKKPSTSLGLVKYYLLSSLNRIRFLFSLCAHITLVFAFRVCCRCALCAALPNIMSDQPSVRPSVPIFSENSATKRHYSSQQTSLKRSFVPPITSVLPSHSLSNMFQPISSEKSMPPQVSAQRNVQAPASSLRRMQLSSSAQRSGQPQIGIERSIPSLMEVDCNMQPSSVPHGLSTSAQYSKQLMPADVRVMFQPPYAVQNVVDTELKYAMLNIINRMCNKNLLKPSCTAFQHYRKEQPVADPKPTKLIWAPQSSDLLNTYPWLLPDRGGDVDKRSNNQMRHLWSTPPASSGQPKLEMLKVVARSKTQGGSLPAPPSPICSHTQKMKSTVHQAMEQSAQSNLLADLFASPINLPASIQSVIFVQSANNGHSQAPIDNAASQKLALQTEPGPSVGAQLSSVSCDDVSSIISSTGTDVAQSSKSVVASENVQFVNVPENKDSLVLENMQFVLTSESKHLEVFEDMQTSLVPLGGVQSELCKLPEERKLAELPEWQKMQQQQLQAMREKRALKKKKQQEKKKRKQKKQLQYLQQNQCDNEGKSQLPKSQENLEHHKKDVQAA